MPVRTLALAAAVLALSGCNSVSTTVDNESADGVKSSFFIEDDGHYAGNHGLVRIFLTTFSDGCTTYAGYQEELNDLDLWGNWDLLDDIEDLWADYFPETFEVTVIDIRVDDTDDSVAGLDFKGVDWNDTLTDDDETQASFTRFKKALDSDYWETYVVGGDREDYEETWLSDDGEMSIGGHTPSESVRGSFNTTLVQADDGDTVDDLTARFNAERCDDYEDEIW